jgi:16S rRNA (uracil1498-N3)-methyltransferase
MTRRRFIADEVSFNRAALTGSHAAHLARVLRARIGQEFDIATGSEVRQGRISAITDDRVEFELGDVVTEEVIRPITLVLAVFKFDRFEWAVEKCTELGAAQIVPVIARRTDTHLAHAAEKRVERWRRIAHEASQQSRRTAAPIIPAPIKLKGYLENPQPAMRILLAENEGQVQLGDVCGGSDPIALAIGPEGGWAEDELKMFSAAGWQPASLGSTILRAETAAIAALAIVQSLSD